MMKHFLADGVFETGVQNYLKERAYKNANVDHLWEELTYVSISCYNHKSITRSHVRLFVCLSVYLFVGVFVYL